MRMYFFLPAFFFFLQQWDDTSSFSYNTQYCDKYNYITLTQKTSSWPNCPVVPECSIDVGEYA